MARHAWLIVSLICGIGYGLAAGQIPLGAWHIALKGGGVAALAVYALVRSGPDNRPIALVMALGALGDVLIELSLVAGALAFLAGHAVACRLYWANRREGPIPGITFALIGLPILAEWVSARFDPALLVYASGLAAMVGCAWLSRFRRDRVALGAALFAVSDLLLFAQMGLLSHSVVPGLLIWPLYYLGQLLVTLGVVGFQGRITAPSGPRARGKCASATDKGRAA